MSFINLLKNDVWSEADIINRTEAMIASEFPAAAVAILNRKATGALLGQYTLTGDEQIELGRYAMVSESARQAGIDARADMALLQSALDVESAQKRLTLPVVTEPAMLIDETGAEIINPALAQDAAERTAAQAVIDTAGVDVLALLALRHPVEVSDAE